MYNVQIKNNFTNNEKLGVFSPLILLPLGPTNLNYELIYIKDFHLLLTKNRMGGAFQLKSWQFMYLNGYYPLCAISSAERVPSHAQRGLPLRSFFTVNRYMLMYILNDKHTTTNT